MLASIIEESPVLAGIAGAVVALLAILLAGAVISNFRDRRRAARPAPGPGYLGDPDEATMPPGPGSAPYARRGFGLGAVMTAFLIGLVAGATAVVSASKGFTTVVQTLAELVDLDQAVGQAAADTVGEGSSPALGPVRPAGNPPADIMAKLAAFAEGLRESVPRAAGPELSLTRVDLDGMTLNLGYAVGRVMAEDEVAAFNAYIQRTVRSLFCDREAREIRYLNENGVAFEMEYVDPRGKTVTRLTVSPNFCA
ncbi:MAG TPA: hypothetical protein VFK86_05610 [Bauldia sp.]|nr:hypothetical protein [Bauldia sp.]